MSLLRLAGIPAAAMLLVSLLSAAPSIPQCMAQNLADYELLVNGCIIGTNPTFTYKDFTFQVLSSTNYPLASVAQLAQEIDVSPIFSVDRQLSLNFSSSLFSVGVGPGQSVEYLIGYTVDPPPPPEIIRIDSQMKTDPPVFPGIAEVTTDLCVYAAFDGANCTGIGVPVSLSVFDNGKSSMLSAQTPDFSPPAVILGVRDIISLNGGATGSASFTSFGSGTGITGIPEPSTVLLLASALTLLFVARGVSAKAR
jgi:hypothetical protein